MKQLKVGTRTLFQKMPQSDIMTVAELEKILAVIVDEGKGNYQVDTYDWDVGTVSVDDDNQYVTLTM